MTQERRPQARRHTLRRRTPRVLGDGVKPTVERISPGYLVALVTDVEPVPTVTVLLSCLSGRICASQAGRLANTGSLVSR
jgi:hypothetical protein